MPRIVLQSEITSHNTPDDVWIVVNGIVYDLTEFAPDHPGGSEIIYQYAGHDATDEYNKFHAPSLIQKTLDKEHRVGSFDASTATDEWKSAIVTDKSKVTTNTDAKPPLSDIINLYDFERVASTTLSNKAWAYISGASNDCLTRDANLSFLQRIWLRPAVMRDVGAVSTKTTLFGCNLDMPVYIAPTGTVRTAGEEGELALAKGAANTGIIHCISTPSSYPHEEVLDATPQHAFLQLYVNKDRQKSGDLVRRATATGKVKAIFVTVDLPVVSKREADERAKNETSGPGKDWKGAGLARQTGSFIDPTLNWNDISWLRRLTDLPIVIKGIQRWEDAKLAMQRGCDGIVLSNHGGRAADTAPPSIVLLLELHRNCPEIFHKLTVLIDGGFRRGSDVVKAICLGASAVGIGRPFFYSVNYGQEGVEHAAEILKDEIETAMRLCGMTDLIKDASPDYVNTSDIDHHVIKGGHPYARRRGHSKL
ncbi:mitochondrial cytochrome b2-like protein [Thelonectria olida]|uniref:L-lactate dehydrogenase (cytochrome) n=1 Tax=Thelonectria olida TaxID=1576542 RepID=A0A9P8VX00_9HYPO|nr:mitochondrial cytochrome b2-like protein [Thelonectria olida]